MRVANMGTKFKCTFYCDIFYLIDSELQRKQVKDKSLICFNFTLISGRKTFNFGLILV